ncbi:MAG: hypothetical protein HY064_13440 [Bacteroidetes bacterium]|nr:hypothetical protein [Bacteroidota bacterium]
MSGGKKNKSKLQGRQAVSNIRQGDKPAPKQRTARPVQKGGISGFLSRNLFQKVLFLLCFVVYGNGIYNGYALDDEFYTNSKEGGNKLTQKGWKGIPAIWHTRTFFNNDGSGYSWRPVVLTTFAIEAALFGEHPHISHFISVFLYGIILVLLFGILRKWFSTQGDWFSFFVCLIFLVHPLHTEVVDNIKCRDELLALLFSLLTIRSIWFQFDENRPKSHFSIRIFSQTFPPLAGPDPFPNRSRLSICLGKMQHLIIAPVFFGLGMLSKHTVIPFYATLPLALWFFTNANWKKIALYVLPLIAVGLFTVLLQKMLLPPQTRTFQQFENPLPTHPGILNLFATAFYVLAKYIWLHVIPYPLVYYYGYNYVPLATWSNPVSIFGLVAYGALGIIALRELKKKSIVGFGLLFYLINLAAYSNILEPAPGLMAERFVFDASLGFCIIAVWFIFRWMKTEPLNFKWGIAQFAQTRAVLIFLALIFTVRCWFRNEDWESKMTLYSHDIAFTHESAKANMLLGALVAKSAMQARLDASRLQNQRKNAEAKQKMDESASLFLEARSYYKKATEIADYYPTAWSNLGTTYFFVDEPKPALSYFLKAVKLNPKYGEGLFNTGMAYDKLENHDSAVWYLSACIRVDSTYVSAYEQLGRIQFSQDHDTAGTINLLHIAARKKPDSEAPWNSLANFYTQMKDTASAAGAMEMAAKINPANYDRMRNLAAYFYQHHNMEKYNYYTTLYNEQVRIAKKKAEDEGTNDQQR